MIKIFSYVILIKIFLSEIIKIPFGIINTEKDSESYHLIGKLLFNKLYINLTIGTPPKKIKVYLRKDSYALYISEKNFNKSYSDSYKSNNILETFFLDIYTTGYISKEIIRIGDYQNNNNTQLDFVLAVSDDNSLGALGLKVPHNFPEGMYSFIHSLKNNSIISSYTWTLKYYSNKKLIDSINDKDTPIGELIIGGEPHEYEENKAKYPSNEYLFVEAPIHSYKYYWDLTIKSIYIISDSKIEMSNNNYKKDEVSLKAESSIIFGTKVYYDLIYSHFFKKYGYATNKICEEKKVPNKSNFNYIECSNNKELFDIKKFPNIYFESYELNKTFELTHEDLFVLDEETNKYIFLIVFPNNYVGTEWGLGIPFLRKYQFTFNEDKKVIGFYNDENKININNNDGKDKKIGLYILFGFLFLLFCGLLITLGMFIHKYFYGEKRKKKANELDDDFTYETNKNNNSDNKINKDNNERLMDE